MGDKIAQSADVTVVLASGQMAKLLRAGISAAGVQAEGLRFQLHMPPEFPDKIAMDNPPRLLPLSEIYFLFLQWLLASGQMAKLLRAGISAAEPVEEKSKVIVFGDTFSPSAYASLLHSLEGKSFTLLAISEAEESLQLRGAYSVLKQQLQLPYHAPKSTS